MQEYNKTDKQIHWLSQLLAKTGRAFVPEQADDSHTNLYFDSRENRMLGRWIERPRGKIILALNLKSLSFEWLDAKLEILAETPVLNKNMQELEESVSEYPASTGLRSETFSKALHFEIPEYNIEKLMPGDVSYQGLKSWMYFRDLANQACAKMLIHLKSEREIRIWPHHFDTGIYTLVNGNLGLGFGLAMKDTMVGKPYFYISGYNAEEEISYNELENLSVGKWEVSAAWKGAVLPINDLASSSSDEAMKTIQTFIIESSDWYLNQ